MEDRFFDELIFCVEVLGEILIGQSRPRPPETYVTVSYRKMLAWKFAHPCLLLIERVAVADWYTILPLIVSSDVVGETREVKNLCESLETSEAPQNNGRSKSRPGLASFYDSDINEKQLKRCNLPIAENLQCDAVYE